jgi:hypothetical protein
MTPAIFTPQACHSAPSVRQPSRNNFGLGFTAPLLQRPRRDDGAELS